MNKHISKTCILFEDIAVTFLCGRVVRFQRLVTDNVRYRVSIFSGQVIDNNIVYEEDFDCYETALAAYRFSVVNCIYESERTK